MMANSVVRIERFAAVLAVVLGLLVAPAVARSGERPDAGAVVDTWYRLVLELVRHTATYSPPVASRGFAYLGIVAYEATASGSRELASLAGQLEGLTPPPARVPGATYDEALVVQAALSATVADLFHNTGPTGRRAIKMVGKDLDGRLAAGAPAEVAERSAAFGRAVAEHVLAWSRSDGGAVVENMGFPLDRVAEKGPGFWVPTSTIGQQQAPLLPGWGGNRPFAMSPETRCDLPPPPAYSEDPSSAFHAEAMEVYDTRRTLTAEQKAIARFWSDDPMLSPTPPGHWISIAMHLLDADGADVQRRADVLARLGIVLADAFIACWHTKYEYDLLRPVTYIRRLVDPKWEPLMITPPFPEYPSGHSTQSGAAAAVLTALFGGDRAFDDVTHVADGLPARHYANFEAAAQEAALSRLYGGIHFRAAIERGLEQGRCVAAWTNRLVTRR
jgi:hypothetical protein